MFTISFRKRMRSPELDREFMTYWFVFKFEFVSVEILPPWSGVKFKSCEVSLGKRPWLP